APGIVAAPCVTSGEEGAVGLLIFFVVLVGAVVVIWLFFKLVDTLLNFLRKLISTLLKKVPSILKFCGRNQDQDDRDSTQIRDFWTCVENCLTYYTQHCSAVYWLRLRDREGHYLTRATIILLILVWLAAWPSVPNYVACAFALLAFY